jgi:hypothetical protein
MACRRRDVTREPQGRDHRLPGAQHETGHPAPLRYHDLALAVAHRPVSGTFFENRYIGRRPDDERPDLCLCAEHAQGLTVTAASASPNGMPGATRRGNAPAKL